MDLGVANRKKLRGFAGEGTVIEAQGIDGGLLKTSRLKYLIKIVGIRILY
jgi:hypothetical protein